MSSLGGALPCHARPAPVRKPAISSVGSVGRSGVGAPLPNPTGRSPRAAAPISCGHPTSRGHNAPLNPRAAASRKNGARSRGPQTPEGRARSAQNALKHGMRAHKHVVLPQEDAAAFAALETAILAELAPLGALQTVLARRIAVAAWRLERADRLAAETGLGPRRRTERGWGPIPQPVRRRPTRRPTGRGARMPQL
jgi:hypothetical protein